MSGLPDEIGFTIYGAVSVHEIIGSWTEEEQELFAEGDEEALEAFKDEVVRRTDAWTHEDLDLDYTGVSP